MLNILTTLVPGVKRTWTIINQSDVENRIAELRRSIEEGHEAELNAYRQREPEKTADVASILGWENEGRLMATTHRDELIAFESQWQDLLGKVGRLNGLFGDYGTAYARLVTAIDDARTSADTELQPLIQEQNELDTLKACVIEGWEKINQQLNGLGVCGLSDRFDGWESLARKAFLREACQARRIDPDNRPQVPEQPATPVPPTPTTSRTIVEKSFGIHDLAMLVGGLAFGSSIGAAIGGISFDSDGWHFSLIFWIMLAVATLAVYTVGRMVFPRLSIVRQLDSIDCYPYLPVTNETMLAKETREKNARLALYGIIAIFAILCLADFYGWWRAVTEQNAAYSGDNGAVFLNPIWAGLAVMFITSLMAFVKLAGVTALVNAQRYLLMDEITKNAIEYSDEARKFKALDEAFIQAQVTAKEYDDKFVEAEANADLRFRREMADLSQQIDRYRKLAEGYETQADNGLRERIQQIINAALLSVQPERTTLAAIEFKIDDIYQKTGSLMVAESDAQIV
ncbi:MAG: hypothetical protein WC107_04345 [Patescibacteria group bacterium]